MRMIQAMKIWEGMKISDPHHSTFNVREEYRKRGEIFIVSQISKAGLTFWNLSMKFENLCLKNKSGLNLLLWRSSNPANHSL